jgi:hypothetical protein
MNVITPDSLNQNCTASQSIFLAGPTHRFGTEQNKHCHWRDEAINCCEAYNFEGTIFSPERSDNFQKSFDYDQQINWELENLNKATCILFWIPRDLQILPAFTTNVEFGLFVNNQQKFVVYGRPNDSVKNRYLDCLWKKYRTNKIFDNLPILVEYTIEILQ